MLTICGAGSLAGGYGRGYQRVCIVPPTEEPSPFDKDFSPRETAILLTQEEQSKIASIGNLKRGSGLIIYMDNDSRIVGLPVEDDHWAG